MENDKNVLKVVQFRNLKKFLKNLLTNTEVSDKIPKVLSKSTGKYEDLKKFKNISKKLLTSGTAYDILSELPLRAATKCRQHKKSQLVSELTRCMLSQNSSLHKKHFWQASLQKSSCTNNCFSCTLTNKQQCNPERFRKK